jgi:hypothetical protein
MYHSANLEKFGAGRDRQMQLLAEAEHDHLVKLAWLPGAKRRAAKRAIEKEWELLRSGAHTAAARSIRSAAVSSKHFPAGLGVRALLRDSPNRP